MKSLQGQLHDLCPGLCLCLYLDRDLDLAPDLRERDFELHWVCGWRLSWCVPRALHLHCWRPIPRRRHLRHHQDRHLMFLPPSLFSRCCSCVVKHWRRPSKQQQPKSQRLDRILLPGPARRRRRRWASLSKNPSCAAVSLRFGLIVDAPVSELSSWGARSSVGQHQTLRFRRFLVVQAIRFRSKNVQCRVKAHHFPSRSLLLLQLLHLRRSSRH